MTRHTPLKTAAFFPGVFFICLLGVCLLAPFTLLAQDGEEDEEIIFFDEEEKEETYLSKSIRKDRTPKKWDANVKLGGYWENEIAVDLRQENSDEDLDEAPILDAIFENAASSADELEDLDSYWDSAAEDVSENVSNADVLTYDQALQLGLTPKEDKE